MVVARYRRLALLGGLFASSSTLVFGGLLPGVAHADSDVYKVNGSVIVNSHADVATLGSCLSVDTTGSAHNDMQDLKVTGVSPTQGTVVFAGKVPAHAVSTVDISSALAGLKTDPVQGWKVKIDLGGQHTNFWVADATATCVTSPGVNGTTGKHKVKPATMPATSAVCHTENGFLQSLTPAAGSTVKPGDTIGLTFNDESVLNMASLKFTFATPTGTVDVTHDPATVINPPAGAKITTVRYTLPTNLPGGAYSATVYANDSDHVSDCGSATWAFTVDAPTTPTVTPTASKCSAGQLGATLPATNSVTAGNIVGVVYHGANLDQSNLTFTVNGQQITPLFDPQTNGDINLWYATPTSITGGTYQAEVKAYNTGGQCSQKAWTFQIVGNSIS